MYSSLRHHPFVRANALLLIFATLVLAFLGYPPKVTAQTVERQDATGLPALNGTSVTGRALPAPLKIALDGSFPVSATTTPTLEWKDVPAGVGQVRFAITTLAEKSPRELWFRNAAVGSDRTASVTVPAGIVAQGHTYAWAAQSTTNAAVTHGPFSLTIDLERSGSQPIFNAGSISVAEATGDAIYTHQGPQLSTVGGPAGWTLIHRATNTPQAGLPDGWRLVIAGTSGWDAIRLNADGSVTLSTATGVGVTYVQRNGQWQPQVGTYNAAGEATQLFQNADGTFSTVDGNRVVTVLSKPTANQDGHPVSTWAMDTPALQQHWADGRLRDLTDPVTQNQMVFLYSGDEGCADTHDPGFIAVPMGMLCGTIDWTGGVTALEYVDTPTGPQVGRIVNGLGLGIYAQVSDIGWDHSGRIVETRTPLATSTVAAHVVDGLGVQDTRAMTQITYDASGRVATLTTPAGLISEKHQQPSREQRATKVFTYAPFTVQTEGVTTPMGFDSRDWLDPVTLHLVKQQDESGNVVTTEYDASGNPTKVVDHSSGTTTETIYNRAGRPVEQIGPTKGALTSPTAPKTLTAYDENQDGKAWKGLASRYWDNAGFNGAPATGSTGPTLPGTTTPVTSLSLNWASNPTGAQTPFSIRLTGVYVAPEQGSYTFENTTSAKLWVGSNLCATTCTQTIAKDAAVSIRIDATSPTGAATGINALVTTPDGKRSAIPTQNLEPEYGLATSSSVRENDGTGARMLKTKMVYDTTTTQLLETISPSGATIKRAYEPFDPSKSLWGRSTSVTNAAGQTTGTSYYQPGETAADCAGNQIGQDSQQKAITLPSGQVMSQTSTASGAAVKTSDGVATACGAATSDDLAFTTTTTGLGDTVAQADVPMVAGDPLANGTATRTSTDTSATYERDDINGNAWETVDSSGTKTVRYWNQLTGTLDRVVETTKDGESRTSEYTYTPGGEVATVSVNGHLLITNEYAPNGALIRSTLGNGAVQTFELDQNNNARKVMTVYPNGEATSETMVHSPAGRLLSRTLAGPTGTATYHYTYNADGRLTDTQLTGTTPAKQTRWQSAYTGSAGANGNRASLTATLADGTEHTTDFAYGSNNQPLTATSGTAAEAITYDAAGRATKIGNSSIAYDATGKITSATDGTRTYAFSPDGATTTFTRTTDGTPQTITATATGETLILGADQRIAGQLISPAEGVEVILDKNGAPARWIYDDSIGNAAWTSTGDAAPAKTHLYSPDGLPISVERAFNPKTPTDLITDGLGWMDGGNATKLRLATPVAIIGDRAYSQEFGRWLQADPTVGATTNAYEYALGDPINQSDPTGNAPWGWIAGAIAATVAGVLIGSLTFGIGGVAVLGYGYAAIAAQVAMGVVVGAATSAIGETVTQLVDNGGSFGDINWASVGIAAGIGAATGGLVSGASSVVTKMVVPYRTLRAYAANTPNEAAQKLFSPMRAYNQAWKKHIADNQLDIGDRVVLTRSRLRGMFEGTSAKTRAYYKVQAQLKTPQGARGAAGEFRPNYGTQEIKDFFKATSSHADNLGQGGQNLVAYGNTSKSLSNALGNQNNLSQNLRQISGGSNRPNTIYQGIRESQQSAFNRQSSGSISHDSGEFNYQNALKHIFS